MKAVFFKTSSAKKSRNKKPRQHPFRSNSDYSSSSAAAANAKKNSGELLLLRTNSNASSIFSPSVTDSSTCSSRSSSISSNSRSGSERIKQPESSLDFEQTSNQQAIKRDMGEKCGCTVGMCIFFICLVSLVFWGKVFAIVTCTSACLFFAPCRRQQRWRPESAASGVDSEEYKKRVIMEGLLERIRRPRVLLQP